MKKIFLLLFLLLSSKSAHAASTYATIDTILLYEAGDLVYIYPKGGVQSPPACHGSNGDYISFKLSRPRAQEYLSTLMMAFAAKKKVRFRTAGACIDQSVSDTLEYFAVYND